MKTQTKTEYEVTPTPQQKKAFKNIQKMLDSTGSEKTEDSFETQKEALIDAGYSESAAQHPKRIKQSKGFQSLLKDIEFTKDDRLKILSGIAHDKDKRATISAIREANKMLGDHAPTRVENMTPSEAVGSVLTEIEDTD